MLVQPTALITGAGGGIGRAVSAELAGRGHPVALLDTDAELVAGTAARIDGTHPCRLLVADVTDAAQVERAVTDAEAALGPIGVLVNVAGVLRAGPVLELADADWDACLAVNATGVWHTGRAVGRRMYQRGGGSIVTVSSNAAAVPRWGLAPYAASKAAATMITQCLGLELAPRVRCNVVAPGSTDTGMLRRSWPDPADEPGGTRATVAGAPERFRLGIPLGRVAQPGDIAAVVAFLAGEQARHVTLQTLTVDGGATLGV